MTQPNRLQHLLLLLGSSTEPSRRRSLDTDVDTASFLASFLSLSRARVEPLNWFSRLIDGSNDAEWREEVPFGESQWQEISFMGLHVPPPKVPDNSAGVRKRMDVFRQISERRNKGQTSVTYRRPRNIFSTKACGKCGKRFAFTKSTPGKSPS